MYLGRSLFSASLALDKVLYGHFISETQLINGDNVKQITLGFFPLLNKKITCVGNKVLYKNSNVLLINGTDKYALK